MDFFAYRKYLTAYSITVDERMLFAHLDFDFVASAQPINIAIK
ncbi:hypothetical protein FDUTEX481_03763 [Tolypothrix sp. PCC 7601]|nr:hypothetical protein FDUTEX481_03763 [Tolypothrix sp. PCC 7601]